MGSSNSEVDPFLSLLKKYAIPILIAGGLFFATLTGMFKPPVAQCKCTDTGAACTCSEGDCGCSDCPAKKVSKP